MIAACLLLGDLPVCSAAELRTGPATLVFEQDGLLAKFNDALSLRGMAYFRKTRRGFTVEEEAAAKVDAVVRRVGDILDMFPHNMNFMIVLLPSAADVRKVLREKYMSKAEYPAFYDYKDKKVYVSVDDLDIEVFSHEIAHVIMSHYFGVQPSAKIHEVLAHYVTEHIRD